jgi:hypothetical protein
MLHNRFFRFLLVAALVVMAALTVRQALATAEVVSGGLSWTSTAREPHEGAEVSTAAGSSRWIATMREPHEGLAAHYPSIPAVGDQTDS